jgi:hypothetical protein
MSSEENSSDNIICNICREEINPDRNGLVDVTSWLDAYPKCERCAKDICGNCLVTCYDCHNDSNNGNEYPFICFNCFESDRKQAQSSNKIREKNYLTRVDCEYHLWYTCTLPHYDETLEEKKKKTKNECRECRNSANYAAKYDY